MKDKAGRQLVASDIIVYGHNKGRSAGLRYGVILEIKRSDRSDRKEYASIVGIDDDWDRTPKASKRTSLKYGERMLVVTRDDVPAPVLNVVDQVLAENGYIKTPTIVFPLDERYND